MSGESYKNLTMRIAIMTKFTKQLSVAGAVTLLTVAGVFAQTNPTDNATQPVRVGQVVVPERPTATDAATTSNLRPALTERPKLPPEVLDRIERFKLDSRKYIEQQEALKKRLLGADDKERAIIRARIQDLREQWLERARELRAEYRDRQQELIEKLPGHREVLESIRSSAQEQLKDAQRDTRTRRGDD